MLSPRLEPGSRAAEGQASARYQLRHAIQSELPSTNLLKVRVISQHHLFPFFFFPFFPPKPGDSPGDDDAAAAGDGASASASSAALTSEDGVGVAAAGASAAACDGPASLSRFERSMMRSLR